MKFRLITWIAGIAFGATAGYIYWYYVGCASGSCPITSSPVNSTLYGSLLGGLFLNTFSRSKREADQNHGK